MMPITIPRTVALLVIALLAALADDVGPNHFWLSIAVTLWAAIMAVRDLTVENSDSEWSEVFLNLTFIVLVVNLVPNMWHVATVVGAMIVQAPATVAQPRGLRMYAYAAGGLLLGLSISGFIHNPPLWQLTLGCMTAMYFPILLFARWQATRHLRLHAKASAINSMRLVAGGVAHDFNNYLTSVLGNAELARAELLTQPSTDTTRLTGQALDNVISGTDKARSLAKQLLSFSRATPSAPIQVDVAQELHSLIELLKGSLPKATTLKLNNLDRENQSLVYGNPVTLQQLFMNLILNATESGVNQTEHGASDEGHAVAKPLLVTVTIAREAQPGSENDTLVIVVSDNGRGIAPATRKTMFEPFVSTKTRGHGLGLAAAKEIITQHNGKISVQSQVGEGTSVSVRLPITESESTAAGRANDHR